MAGAAGRRNRLFEWYNGRLLRERLVLLGAALGLILVLGYVLVLQPLDRNNQHLRRELTRLQTQIDTLKTQQKTLEVRLKKDPELGKRQRLAVLENEAQKLRKELRAVTVSLVPPQEMADLLRDLLTREEPLELVSLENLPPERISFGSNQTQESQEAEAAPTLYRHPLKLTFRGNYLAMLRYLRQLQDLPPDLVWQEVTIETQDYPRATVKLQVYTLGFEEGWIGG